MVVWSDFLRNKTDRKLTVVPQTYPGPIKKLLSQRTQTACKECNFCRTPIGCYVWVVQGVIDKIQIRVHVRPMIYLKGRIGEHYAYLGRNASVLRHVILRCVIIVKTHSSVSAALIRACEQVGTTAHGHEAGVGRA